MVDFYGIHVSKYTSSSHGSKIWPVCLKGWVDTKFKKGASSRGYPIFPMGFQWFLWFPQKPRVSSCPFFWGNLLSEEGCKFPKPVMKPHPLTPYMGGLPKIGGTPPKWMVYDGKPKWKGWFGGKPTIFGNTHMLIQFIPTILPPATPIDPIGFQNQHLQDFAAWPIKGLLL